MFLRSKEFDARGLDYSDELVARLRETYPGANWQVGDIRAMPYSDGTFDAVLSWGVIEHDEAGPGATLREFYRVLRPGGTVIVTVPVDSAAQRRAAEYFREGDGVQTFFQYFMTAEELADHLGAAGLRVVDQGILPNAVIHLVSPRLAGRLRGPALRTANFLVSTFMSWLPRYCVMRYAVAVRDGRGCS